MFNPYRMIARQVRALLQAEALLPPEEKKRCQWQLRVAFCGTFVVVGKGDVNTCFVMLGDSGKRQIGYPHHVLDRLDKLARQSHPLYVVEVGGKRGRFYSRDAALAVTARAGGVVYGVSVENTRHVAYRARENAIGAVKWLPALNGDENVHAERGGPVRPRSDSERGGVRGARQRR